MQINEITDAHNKPLMDFKTLIDAYFQATGKKIVIDDVIEPLLIESHNNDVKTRFDVPHLSSGEKLFMISWVNTRTKSCQACNSV